MSLDRKRNQFRSYRARNCRAQANAFRPCENRERGNGRLDIQGGRGPWPPMTDVHRWSWQSFAAADPTVVVHRARLMRCKQFNAKLSTIIGFSFFFFFLSFSFWSSPFGSASGASTDPPDIIGTSKMDRPRRALYGPSVSSRFQTRSAEELAAILSRNAPKVKQYFIERLSRSNFYGSIYFTPVTYRFILFVALSR